MNGFNLGDLQGQVKSSHYLYLSITHSGRGIFHFELKIESGNSQLRDTVISGLKTL
jgi:hypothetical protein